MKWIFVILLSLATPAISADLGPFGTLNIEWPERPQFVYYFVTIIKEGTLQRGIEVSGSKISIEVETGNVYEIKVVGFESDGTEVTVSHVFWEAGQDTM